MNLKVYFCFNTDHKLLALQLQEALKDYEDIELFLYNETYSNEHRKSNRIKSHFATSQIPFCGVYKNNKSIKGFYSEVNNCTLENILTYINNLLHESK